MEDPCWLHQITEHLQVIQGRTELALLRLLPERPSADPAVADLHAVLTACAALQQVLQTPPRRAGHARLWCALGASLPDLLFYLGVAAGLLAAVWALLAWRP